MGRYVRKDNGRIFPWTEHLAKKIQKGDTTLKEIEGEFKKGIFIRTMPPKVEDEENEQEETGEDEEAQAKTPAQIINDFVTKGDFERWTEENLAGYFTFDRRKSLENLKAEALNALEAKSAAESSE